MKEHQREAEKEHKLKLQRELKEHQGETEEERKLKLQREYHIVKMKKKRMKRRRTASYTLKVRNVHNRVLEGILIFRKLDTDKDGVINLDNLIREMSEAGVNNMNQARIVFQQHTDEHQNITKNGFIDGLHNFYKESTQGQRALKPLIRRLSISDGNQSPKQGFRPVRRKSTKSDGFVKPRDFSVI